MRVTRTVVRNVFTEILICGPPDALANVLHIFVCRCWSSVFQVHVAQSHFLACHKFASVLTPVSISLQMDTFMGACGVSESRFPGKLISSRIAKSGRKQFFYN